ncbi:MAG: UDP-2,3-diacylglucosamine hydrolase [Chromatiaceae bacterium]|nr:UDP-2,3-diacylglucosamine hydrolase [Gammaproteobacteria bacterium]MCP5316680.1 UDP-2,3-diacylglucosamine hydrolase [Chromatiaceae bacterium]MCP5429606.1 UDP-2,3-diacylglucosamine hydrolase [Chromatiaceae bacterium]
MQKILMVVLMVATSAAVAAPSSLLVYRVWEQGAEPYVSRVLVTADHVRLDEGSDTAGYTLFDRRQESIYNISVDDRSILVMDSAEPLPAAPDTLILQEQVEGDAEAPLVAGRRPKHVRLLANGELCGELVTIEGVMDEAVRGLAELKRVLARVQAATLSSMPLDMKTPCDLAANVYAADRPLRFGLPLQERATGRSQSLVDFSDSHDADAALFTLPEGFSRRPMFAPGIF